MAGRALCRWRLAFGWGYFAALRRGIDAYAAEGAVAEPALDARAPRCRGALLRLRGTLGRMAAGCGVPGIPCGPADRGSRRAESGMTRARRLRPLSFFTSAPLQVTQPVVTTWAIMAVLAVGSWAATRRLAPSPRGGRRFSSFSSPGSRVRSRRWCAGTRGRCCRSSARCSSSCSWPMSAGSSRASGADRQDRDAGGAGAHRIPRRAFLRRARPRATAAISRSFAKPKLIMLPLNIALGGHPHLLADGASVRQRHERRVPDCAGARRSPGSSCRSRSWRSRSSSASCRPTYFRCSPPSSSAPRSAPATKA